VSSDYKPTPPSRKGRPSKEALARREEVVRLSLTLMPAEAIAKRLRITTKRVQLILAEPEVAGRLAAARRTAFADALSTLKTATRRAVEVLIEEMDGKHAPTRVRAAVEILNAAGATAPKRFDVGVIAGSTDEELWRELRELEQAGGVVLPSAPADAPAHAAVPDANTEGTETP